MEYIFQQPDLEAKMKLDGFVHIPFVDPEILKPLEALFYKKHSGEGLTEMYSNNYNLLDPEYNEEVNAAGKRIFQPYIDQYFHNCTIGGCAFLVKGMGPDSSSDMHQDWNNVDESQFGSYSIWVPFLDVDETNGALQVVAGSHRLFSTIRSVNHPSLFLEFDEALEPYLTPLPMKAGEACVYQHNLFHGSKPNLSSTIRIAFVISILPKNAPFIHYWVDQEKGETRVLKAGNSFYARFLPRFLQGEGPEGIPVGEVLQSIPDSLTTTEALQSFKEHIPVRP